MGGTKKKSVTNTGTGARVLHNRKVGVDSSESQKDGDDIDNDVDSVPHAASEQDNGVSKITPIPDQMNVEDEGDKVSVHSVDSWDRDMVRLTRRMMMNYVMNAWTKFGIEKVMMNAKGFFFFKFSSKEGMMNVIQNGPWMIRTMPIILNVWSYNVSLTKEDLTKVPVWVKLHDVPLTGFTATGLSVIASKIGRLMMLDSYTSTMCLESWGRPNFARAIIEVSAECELKDSIRVGTPNTDGSFTKDVVTIEYEWKPPRCACCKVFGHRDSQCPKHLGQKKKKKKKPVKVALVDEGGFKKIQCGLLWSVSGIKAMHKAGPSTSGVQMSNSFGVFATEEVSKPRIQLNLIDEESDVEGHYDETSVCVRLKNLRGQALPASNNSVCRTVTRIIFGCDPGIVQLSFITMTDQVIHCIVKDINNTWESFVSFVYANNYYIRRRQLWHSLNMHNSYVGANPWMILGDFNVSLSIEESTANSSSCTLAMLEIRECLKNLNMADVNHTGFQYTWNQSPNSNMGMLKKIDRVLANDHFINKYTNAHVIFQPYRISNHCPAVLKIPTGCSKKPKPFKFSNFIAKHTEFKKVVDKEWKVTIGQCSVRLIYTYSE
ncbi:uncharacterized protein [Rutidosis leptorrhynchoides]|uniref:uncharacterized protein n=1 Tax=Rutidosis leptorrhynchoides TaxID=125765 RepID=UPI003A98E9EA